MKSAIGWQRWLPSERSQSLVTGWVLVAVGPMERTAAIHQGYGIRASAVGVIGALGCLALWTGRSRRWSSVLGPPIVAFTGLLAATAGGRYVGA